ncbi:hypothetical protein [Phytoactinopolyspora mesophila]|uniref:Uncharacterized protein n=1 Tax=Phytoactinopolyspora mesophila TaxID=2650750 RepID=A0A7K3M5P6_9ACTN|nr:hypothetical protein [Phytoactinopolyspora mesophila]NDL58644.1 hypothetical protein [Phytoactinopolyspora mesophila]
MPYKGWFSFGGIELFNAERFYNYAPQIAPGWDFLACDECDTLAEALGDGEYRSIVLDEPSWFDPDNPDTYRFAGFLPLSIVGLTDSTRTAPVLSSTRDGGVIGRVRHGVREINVTGVLLGADDCALDAGFEWLKRALDGNPCAGCSGSDLCFFSCCPDIASGTVDPNSEPVAHPVELRWGWTTEGGRWRSGHISVQELPTIATGPEFEPPCDDTTYEVTFDDLQDGQIVDVAVVNADGETLDESGPIVLRRDNWVPNPTFRRDADLWDGHANTITKLAHEDAGQISITTDLAEGDPIATGLARAPGRAGDEWSGRVTLEIDTTSTNLVPNPRVGFANGWSVHDIQAWDLHRSTDQSFSGTYSMYAEIIGAWLVDSEVSRMQVGNEQPPFRINVNGGGDYFVGIHAFPGEDARSVLSATFYDADGNNLGIEHAAFQVATPAGVWTYVSGTVTAPAQAAYVTLQATLVTDDGAAATARYAYWDGAIVTPTGDPFVDYFDGGMPGAAWTGTADMSPSALVTDTDAEICISVGTDELIGARVTLQPGQPAEVAFTAIPVTGTQPLNLEITACGDVPAGTLVRISQAIMSRGTAEVEYFDGESEIDGYDVSWRGGPDHSRSVMSLAAMPVAVTAPDDSGPVRPQVSVLGGDDVHVTEVVALSRQVIDPAECAELYIRTIRDVTVTEGPVILERFDDDECSGRVARIEWTMTAGIPWIWRTLAPEWQPADTGQVVPAADDCPPDQGPPPPLSDPNCPQPPDPPRAPTPPDCLEDVTTYRRSTVVIPGDLLSPWENAVPIIELENRSSTAVRQARVRFYPNPLNRTEFTDLDPCGWCGEFIVSYIPGNSTMTLDGMTQRVSVERPGGQEFTADHLIYGSGGGPMTWPELSCGLSYMMTVDFAPDDADVVTTSVQLAVRS